ncbi:hypothetical protein CAPTEDRAFT_215672 [Capitella teleta]|uniref:LRRCT domain-containing protein n=1 Tax=Capitella teleta TaxID=283909 RepID=R7TTL9_CAPTE|nr:hypothetical protein CAPTEDRAFT_215672 [Capitella teleta]|eukprot:ELT97029.1 hypothetical protein CAPTEDRAFT_215672 [Capitella teleta]
MTLLGCCLFLAFIVEIHTLTVNKDSESLSTLSDVSIDLQVTKLLLEKNLFTALEDNMFSNFTYLAEIFLNHNPISHVSPSAFDGCPIEKIELAYNKLSTFPDFNIIAPTLRYLQLSGNPLSHITADDVKNLTLDVLYIRFIRFEPNFDVYHNLRENLMTTHISFIQNITDEFCGMPNLHTARIFLGSFLNEPVTDEHFKNASLSILTLEQMQLTTFPYFEDQAQLMRIMTIVGNSFADPIEANTFAHYKKLKELNMKNNGISVFPDISPLSDTLKFLNLADNHITSVPRDLLANFSSLIYLSIEGNPLGKIPDLGDVSTNIETLIMKSTSLGNVSCENLAPFTSLTEINLGQNSIEEVSALSCINSTLVKLYLGDNAIESLDLNAWTFLGSLTELDLSGNPLRSLCENYASVPLRASIHNSGLLFPSSFGTTNADGELVCFDCHHSLDVWLN